MVEKNRKKLNEQRKKQGKKEITSVDSDVAIFKGRNIIFPLFLFFAGLFFGVRMYQIGDTDTLYWLTVGSYILLSFYFYFLRRPYLKVTNDAIATSKWGRERTVTFSNIKKMTYSDQHVSIAFAEGRDWFFSKTLNRYDTEEMTKALLPICQKYGIDIEKI